MPRITTTAIDLAIAERITTLRKELGITQAQLADAIGVTFQQVQKYEKGLNRISAAALHAIAMKLGCGPAELYGSSGPDQSIPGTERLLTAWDNLSPDHRSTVLIVIEALAQKQNPLTMMHGDEP